MLNFSSLITFSHIHCVAICTFLVPANLLVTLQTLLLAGFNRSIVQTRGSAMLAISLALIMVAHVMTWFLVGIVQIPTFVLLGLATLCLGINLWAIVLPQNLTQFLQGLWFQTVARIHLQSKSVLR